MSQLIRFQIIQIPCKLWVIISKQRQLLDYSCGKKVQWPDPLINWCTNSFAAFVDIYCHCVFVSLFILWLHLQHFNSDKERLRIQLMHFWLYLRLALPVRENFIIESNSEPVWLKWILNEVSKFCVIACHEQRLLRRDSGISYVNQL